MLRDDPRCPWLQKYDMAKFLGCDILKGYKIMLLHKSIFLSLFLSQFLSSSPSPLWISNLQEVLSLFLLHLSDFVSLPPTSSHSGESCVCMYFREGGKRNCCISKGMKMEAIGRWTAASMWIGRLKQTLILNNSELRFLHWTAGFFSLEILCQDGGGAVNYLCYGPYLKSATP